MQLNIRRLRNEDAPVISRALKRIGWTKTVTQYQTYFQLQQECKIVALVAEIDSRFAGYVTIRWSPEYAPLKEQGIPEIQDLNVLPEFRRRRVASALMDEAEAIVSKTSSEVGIGVGLHPGYNAAQRMYVRRGYIPDGRGVSWRGAFITEGQEVVADDDLILHLTKRLE